MGIQMDDRQRLEKRLEAAENELATLAKAIERKGDYGAGKGDPRVVRWEMNLALRQQTEARVEQIRKALRRLEASTYHTCERCGNEIVSERLEAIPETALCSKCAHEVAREI
jgi:RNA polymerase-binding transcription factor DksA